jgi:hypothetical protein
MFYFLLFIGTGRPNPAKHALPAAALRNRLKMVGLFYSV